MKLSVILFLSLVLGSCLPASGQVTISSPDGYIKLILSGKEGVPRYRVTYKKQTIINESPLELVFAGNDRFGTNISVGKTIINPGVEKYTLPVGKTSQVNDAYNEAIIPLTERSGSKRRINFHVRIFNGGAAFRYEFPEQASWQQYILTDENTTFELAGNPSAKVAILENFNTSHEHRYRDTPFGNIGNDTLMDMPALFTFTGNVYLAITEANLVNYAGMSLIKRNGRLQSQLSPLPGQTEVKVKATLPHQTPWRVLMISDRIGSFIESNIINNLGTPTTLKDLSWLKPGKATFHWWSGDVLPDTTFEAGINFNFNKYYIDFCARNGIQFHTVIGNRGVAWYQNDGNEYQPGANTDITKPRVSLEIEKICEYAKSKGVGIRFWVHWQALYPQLEKAFALFQNWGISGMMVDFMDRDDQEMIRIQEEILLSAAKHHLEIQFHGAAKPTGLQRTYPNESTREGTLNYENNKWGNLITPNDDINIPFTRGLAGPADYHLGGFHAMPAEKLKVQFTKPNMLGTRCHMLAMYLVLENSMSMVCDYPEAYEGQDGFDLLAAMPTTWDQTVVPGAVIDEWVSVARRKGDDWYIGTISNNQARTITIPLQFLSAGNYVAEIYADSDDAPVYPNKLVKSSGKVTADSSIEMKLAAGGGQVIHIRKQ